MIERYMLRKNKWNKIENFSYIKLGQKKMEKIVPIK